MKGAVLTGIVIALIVLAGVGGYLYGSGQNTAEIAKLSELVETAYPEPPAELKTISGIVKGVAGGTIDLEVSDPDDYLPHLDGSAPAKEMRYVSVKPSTVMVKFDTANDFAESPATLADVTVGTPATVHAATNIRTAKRFDALRIELIQ